MYPRINELVGELHERKISTFLVTNAQFPRVHRPLGPGHTAVRVDRRVHEGVARGSGQAAFQRFLGEVPGVAAKPEAKEAAHGSTG